MSAPLEIEPGDVLLFHGLSFIPWSIRWFDGTDVNHAAIALEPETNLLRSASLVTVSTATD